MKTCRRFRISGIVQGVGFRYYTQKQALRLGLAGWVRNLPGGEVELLACGRPERLDELHAWLLQGPTRASVSGVQVEIPEVVTDPVGFAIC